MNRRLLYGRADGTVNIVALVWIHSQINVLFVLRHLEIQKGSQKRGERFSSDDSPYGSLNAWKEEIIPLFTLYKNGALLGSLVAAQRYEPKTRLPVRLFRDISILDR